MQDLIKKKSNIVFILCAIFVMAMLIYKPQVYMASFSRGLYMFGISVLPSLFPFFVLTKVLTDAGGTGFSKFFKKPVKFLFKLPPSAGYIFMLSILSGYPVGAKLTADFYKKGLIDEHEAKRISSFCSTSGPFFILGTVGASMLVSIPSGIIILTAHILSSLVCGLIFARRKPKKENTNADITTLNMQLNSTSTDFNMADTIFDSVKSILLVGGFICIFYMVIDIFLNTGVLMPLDFLLNKIFSLFNIPKDFSTGFTSGLIEITRGCIEIASLKLELKTSTVLCCGLISSGGLCINMQAYAFLSKCKISALTFFGFKFVHMIISMVLCFLLCLIFM